MWVGYITSIIPIPIRFSYLSKITFCLTRFSDTFIRAVSTLLGRELDVPGAAVEFVVNGVVLTRGKIERQIFSSQAMVSLSRRGLVIGI